MSKQGHDRSGETGATDLAAIAKIVDDAARYATAIPQLSKTGNELSLEEAYRVQELSVQRRQERGEQLAGIKMGFTSRAKMQQMGLSQMIWGCLTDAMRVEDGGEISFAKYVHPRIEPEVAFLMKSQLFGPVSGMEALSAVEAVAPAVEIIDSRYENFKFNLSDVVADNSSSSGFVVGQWHSPDTAIDNLGMLLEINGRPIQIGSSAAILGHPVRALVAASRLVEKANLALEPGWIIMAGGATAAHALSVGDCVRNCVQSLGTLGFCVVA